MLGKKSRSFDQGIQSQKKEDQIKTKMVTSAKNKRINHFKCSLEKIFHVKSKSEQFYKDDELVAPMIPSTIYLTPRQAKVKPIRHSCSDVAARRTRTLRTFDRAISPPAKVSYPDVEEAIRTGNIRTHSHSAVFSRSTSMPVQLSKSHLNVKKCDHRDNEISKPAKRTARKKSFFNCSLFRKRSSSNSKLSEEKSKAMMGRHQTKSLNRSDLKKSSVLSNRCLTLPNLVSVGVDVTSNVDGNQLFSMDLIKDYLNRSNSSLKLLDPRSALKSPQRFTTSIHNYDIMTDDSVILRSPHLSESFYSPSNASIDISRSRFSQIVSSPAVDNRSDIQSTSGSGENKAQFHSASHQYISSPVTNSAFDFWTRPYQEKIKASRRRQLENKVGSKVALLRSLSPYSAMVNERGSIYESIIHANAISKTSSPNSESFYNSIQNQKQPCPQTSVSPLAEKSLLTSPVSIDRRHKSDYQKCDNNYLIYSAAGKSNAKGPTFIDKMITKKEKNQTSTDNRLPFNEHNFPNTLHEPKVSKGVNSSTELILTRTPTPPRSFAESPVSSVCPAPNEFISDLTNLLSAIGNNEPIPPVPPPRTDSVLRSLKQAQQIISDNDKSEQEYDISDEYLPLFSGSNIDRCDIEQYHKWLEKLPYKISDLPNLIRARKSVTNLCRTSPSIEEISDMSSKIDQSSSRKLIKSWNPSEPLQKQRETGSITSRNKKSTVVSSSIKKSLSYEDSLNSSDIEGLDYSSPSAGPNCQLPSDDATLLKQYSHLYSLKPSPSQTPTVAKSNRSRSIDLKNFVKNISGAISISDKCFEAFAERRKSVPNAKFGFGLPINEISGKNSVEGSEYTVYQVL